MLLGLLAAAALTVLLASGLTGDPDRDRIGPTVARRGSTEGGAVTGVATRGPDGGFALWGTDRHGRPLRWDACAAIPFLLNPSGAPQHAERDLRTALDLLARASGLDLVLLGSTDERPSLERPLVERAGDGWRWRPVLVAWDHPGSTDLPLGPHDRGVALPVAVRAGDREALVTGQVVLNAARTDLLPGFGDRRDALGATLVHEIGHILGLAHVADPDQLMAADPGEGPIVLGAGDLAGLAAVGAGAGCLPTPDPGEARGLVTQR